MMQKLYPMLFFALLVAGGVAFYFLSRPNAMEQEQRQDLEIAAVRTTVEGFGRELKSVPVLAPEDMLVASIEDHYAEFLTPQLLETWKGDPSQALGREVSSPWPDRIEILRVRQMASDEYRVEGDIIEVANTEAVKGGVAARRSIELAVRKVDDTWLIADVDVGFYQNTASWETYTKPGVFAIQYPGAFIVEEGEGLGGTQLDTSLARIRFPDDAFEGENTNFVEAYLVVGESADEQMVAGCTAFSDFPYLEGSIQSKTIDDALFASRTATEGAAGSVYYSKLFRTVRDRTCYEIALVLHTGNAANYDPPVEEFDAPKAFSVLEQMLETFRFVRG